MHPVRRPLDPAQIDWHSRRLSEVQEPLLEQASSEKSWKTEPKEMTFLWAICDVGAAVELSLNVAREMCEVGGRR